MNLSLGFWLWMGFGLIVNLVGWVDMGRSERKRVIDRMQKWPRVIWPLKLLLTVFAGSLLWPIFVFNMIAELFRKETL